MKLDTTLFRGILVHESVHSLFFKDDYTILDLFNVGVATYTGKLNEFLTFKILYLKGIASYYEARAVGDHS